MENKDYLKVKKYVFSKLEKLSKKLHYHGIYHTKDVLKSVEKIAKMEKVSEKGLLLLKTATLFHDIGFLERYKNHEFAGVKIARKTLNQFNYSKKDIQLISKIIMATKMPQKPKTKYEKIMCDADLDNLGRKDFFIQAERVRKELWQYGTKIQKKDWYKSVLKLMEGHNYFTKSSKKLRDKVKKENMEELKAILRR